MAAADIARHLSFTDANRDRSLQKYIQYVSLSDNLYFTHASKHRR
jgi:hypothetical protein